jgi:hypothetical protein
MKKLIIAVVLSLCCLLLTPALASAAPSAQLTAPAPVAYDCFGHSVAVSGNTALVGAFNHTVGGQGQAGVVYVFTRTGTTWSQQAKLTASDPALQDWFGYSVALSGNTAVVGAYGKTEAGVDFAGAVFVFTRSGTTWTRQAVLQDPTPVKYESFGESVAVYGDTVLIGAPWKDGTYSRAGTAFVFTRSGTTWTQQAELLRSDTANYDYFGQSVALSRDTALVSVWGKNGFAGAADVFTRSGTTWTQQAELSAPDTDAFGWSVALSGDTALVGARQSTVGSVDSAGNAYVFTRSGTTWTQQAELKASDAATNDEFGASVALSGDSAVVGAWHKTVLGRAQAGACYLFSRLGTTWSARTELRDPNAASNDQFGCSVALADTTLFSGADQRTVSGHARAGAAYVYRLSPTITKLDPASGKRGAIVTISGAFFGAKRGTSYVMFGTAKCGTYLSWNDNRISCRVPVKATLGKLKVTVRTSAGASNTRVFSVKR